MKIGELFIELGFKSDNMKLKDFIHSLGELNISSIVSAAGLKGVWEGIEKVIDVSNNVLRPLSQFSKLTGLATKEAQQLAAAISKFGGGSKTEALAGIRSFQQTMFETSMGKNPSGLWALSMLGIEPGNDPIKKLTEIHKKLNDKNFIEQMSKMLSPEGTPLKIAVANFEQMLQTNLGITDAMLLYLKTSDELYYSKDRLSYLDEQALKTGEELARVWSEVKLVFEVIAGSIASSVGPAITQLGEIIIGVAQFFGQFNFQLRETLRILSLIGAVIAAFTPGGTGVAAVLGSYFALDQIKALREGPSMAHARSGNNSSSSQTNHFAINIHGSNDNRTISDEVTKSIRRMLVDGHSQGFLSAN